VAPPAMDMPPCIDVSPRLPNPIVVGLNPAQKYLQNRDKKLFDSADYFSAPSEVRAATPPISASPSAFEQVGQEATRLSHKESRSSTLSFELFQEIEGGLGDGANSDDDIEDDEDDNSEQVRKKNAHSMRRGSMEEFFVEENQNETVKHAILEKPRLKRWDSGDFYSSPSEYRKMLATQAKEVWRQALDHAEEDSRPRRHRRSSLCGSETVSNDEEEKRIV